jgi:hypothetical protein
MVGVTRFSNQKTLCKKKNNLQEYSAHVAEQITMDHILKKIVVAVKKKKKHFKDNPSNELRKKNSMQTGNHAQVMVGNGEAIIHMEIIPSMTPSESRETGRKKKPGLIVSIVVVVVAVLCDGRL